MQEHVSEDDGARMAKTGGWLLAISLTLLVILGAITFGFLHLLIGAVREWLRGIPR